MGNRLTKIYTKTGDDGSTGLGDGSRVSKHDARVEAYGTVDETNSAIGVVLSCENVPDLIRGYLANVQHDLFDLQKKKNNKDYRMDQTICQNLQNIRLMKKLRDD